MEIPFPIRAAVDDGPDVVAGPGIVGTKRSDTKGIFAPDSDRGARLRQRTPQDDNSSFVRSFDHPNYRADTNTEIACNVADAHAMFAGLPDRRYFRRVGLLDAQWRPRC
jgi:hypothetical protein